MKKLISLLLVFVMALSVMAGCAGNETAGNETVGNESTEPDAVQPVVDAPASALEVLENIWALYGDDEKFPVMGGNPEGGVMDAPAVWDAEYLVNLSYSLQLPEAQMEDVADAASLIHMMNTNTFTGAVLHLNEGVDAATFATDAKDSIMAAQWMCGFPEKLVIADLSGNYLLIAYGVGDAMGPFEAKLAEAYPSADILYSEAIAG
ncbi:MAG: hypothetical protein IJX04_00870 [Oscillospiraceae bacterium]|nr:hypothetical protein [Oscillospiraceae bacterium]